MPGLSKTEGNAVAPIKKTHIVGVSKAYVRAFYRDVSPQNASVRENNHIVRLFHPNVRAGDAHVRPENPNVRRRNPIVRGGNYIVSRKNPIVIEKNTCAGDSLETATGIFGDLLPQYLEWDQKYNLPLEEMKRNFPSGRKWRRSSHNPGFLL